MKAFREIYDDTDEVVFINLLGMLMIGVSLFPDTSGNKVKLIYLAHLDNIGQIGMYSWGSVVLARLYRALCRASQSKKKEICVFLPLLKLCISNIVIVIDRLIFIKV